jgi:hypothetical protein
MQVVLWPIASTSKVVFVSSSLAIIGLLLAACGGAAIKTETALLGTYKIIATSKVQTEFQDFHAQDLLAVRKEPTGTLRTAYEASIAQFTEKHGREPQDDLETAVAICDWVSYNLRHPHFYPEDPTLPRFYRPSPDPKYSAFYWDPAKIISYTLNFDPADAENWPSPFCTQQNFAAAGIMNYAGLHARLCYVEGHDGLEYYSWKYKKWIWCDSTFNEHFVLPHSDGTFEPLGAKELQKLTLFGGIEKVQMVKHGYPDRTIPIFNYLGSHPHGFRRYAPFFFMKTLNGGGSNLSSAYMFSSCILIPDTYVPAANEFVQLELDPTSVFSRLSCVKDPTVLDAPLDALTLGDFVSPRRDGLMVNLRTWLPHAVQFEVQHGDSASWQPLEEIPQLIGTGKTSSSFFFPWSSGVLRFRTIDGVGNTSESLTILLKES